MVGREWINKMGTKNVDHAHGEETELPYIHMSRETAMWIHGELNDWWEMTAADSLHHTFHLTRALLELKMQLGLDVD
jgi:hypothetical protein